jgi:serine/threonine-protein kinase
VKTGVESKILLKDPEEETVPVPGVAAPSRAGRYQVLGEIARGGLGVVMKGKDIDLGREVALKLLQDRHAFEPAAIRRIVEEAQIGGQLQHPGIVPIYEMGLRADNRPYFAMKLVKGRTLASLLEERKDPGQDLARFLRIFEQVCQTMAYAHTRGVIHRDLKPANIMVGAFGEVQLMDWGLAKVVGGKEPGKWKTAEESSTERSPETVRTGSTEHLSKAGTVMGTYAYMAPEQARGETDLLDERCDVFGLGAILCEILTGLPPYVGESTELLAKQARDGLLDPCLKRLEASGAEKNLAHLCQQCLAPSPADRPHNATAVAKEIESYLADAAERARKSELEAAENRVRAEEAEARTMQERRAKRLSISLAATIILALVIVGGAFAWIESARLDRLQQDRERRQEMTERVNGKLGRAYLAVNEALAETDPEEAMVAWDRALAWASDAQEDALSEDLDPRTVDRVEAVLDEFYRGRDGAQAAFDRAEADRIMLRRLESVSLQLGQEWDWAAIDDGYTSAFEQYGVPVNELGIEEAVSRIRESAIVDELVAGIHEWIVAKQRTNRDTSTVSNILQQADPDPWRTELRLAYDQNDSKKITSLVEARNIEELSAYDARLLGESLDRMGNKETALSLLKKAAWLHKDDFWLNFKLAGILRTMGAEGVKESVGYYRAALAVCPESVGALSNLGLAFTQAGIKEDARAAFEEALRLSPDDPMTLWAYGTFLAYLDQDYDAAVRHLERSVQMRPNSSNAWFCLGFAWRQKGNLDEAKRCIDRALKVDPNNTAARAARKELLQEMNRDQ